MVTPVKMRSSSRRRSLSIAALIVVLLGITVGVAIYQDRVAPFQRTILVMNDTSVSMGYFLKRILLSGQSPVSMLQLLTQEEIIKQVAPHPPYNIRVTDADIDQALRETARGASATITEPEFTEWYRQQLNDSQFSDAAYRDIVRARLLRQRLRAYLAEQVHLKVKTLEAWLEAEFPRHQVSYHGFDNSYDSATDTWVKAQLQKMRAARR